MAIAVAIRFMAGRFHATPWGRHVNEGVPEWPPSPWRILRALVSSWKTRAGDISDVTMNSLLAKLSVPPAFRLPPATLTHTEHYVPWEKKGPSDKTKIFDTFVVVDPREDLLAIWPGVELNAAEEDALRRVLSVLPYLGRSESWVSARLETDWQGTANCRPLPEGDEPSEGCSAVHVLVPAGAPFSLESLYVTTDNLRKERYDMANPPSTSWVYYERKLDCFVQRPDGSHASVTDPRRVSVVRFTLVSSVLPSVTDSVKIGNVARAAAMAWYGRRNAGSVSRTLSGKDESGRPLQGHNHAFYLPSDEDGDGKLDHLTVFASNVFTLQEREALGSIDALGMEGGRPPLRLILAGEEELRESDSPLIRQSCVWSSVTPFVLIRHPKWRGGRLVDGPEDQLRLELKRRGLPAPESVERLQDSTLRGRSIPWLSYRRWRGRGAEAGGAYGFRIRFTQPVPGPVALGYGCHFGLGLFTSQEQKVSADGWSWSDEGR